MFGGDDLFPVDAQQNVAGLNTAQSRGAAIMNILKNPAGPVRGFVSQVCRTEGCAARCSPRRVKGSTFRHRIAEIHAVSMKRLSKVEAADDPSDGADDE
jgi:single-strand DNA-binding protein